jgi:hypothetical protein
METDEAKDYMTGHKEGTFVFLDVRQMAEYEKAYLTALGRLREARAYSN